MTGSPALPRPAWRLALALAVLLAPAGLLAPTVLLAPCGPAASAWAAEGEADPVAQVQQQVLPALTGRQAAARARVQAGTAWFAGHAELAQAFPDLAGAPLHAAGFLQAQLGALDARGQARARERVAAAPDGLDPRTATRLAQSVAQTLDEEARADDLRRRLLLGLQAGLVAAPDLAQQAQETQVLAGWRAQAAQVPAADASPEQAQVTLALAGAAGQAIARLQVITADAWRAMTIPGDLRLSQDVAAELDQLPEWSGDPAGQLRDLAWLDRLERAAPLVDPALQDRIARARQGLDQARLAARIPELETLRAALLTQLQAPPTLSASSTPDKLQADLDQAQAALQTLPPAPAAPAGAAAPAAPAGAAASPPVSLDPLDPLRDRVTALQREVAQAQVEVASRRLQLAQAQAAAEPGSSPGQAQAEVDAARRKADDALARAVDADSAQESEFRTRLAAFQGQIATLLEAEQARRGRALEDQAALDARWQKAAAEADAAIALPSLSVGREGRIDDAFRALRAVVADLRTEVATRRDHLALARGRPAQLRSQVPDPSTLSDAVRLKVEGETSSASADLDAVLAQGTDNARAELDAALSLLAQAKADRRRIRPDVSPRARDDILQTFMPELRLEVDEAPVVISSELRATGRAIRALPGQVTDLNLVLAFLTRSIELVLLGIAWLALRRNAVTWARRLLHALWRQRREGGLSMRGLQQGGWFVDGDVRALDKPLGPVLFAVADIGLAWGLFRMTRQTLTPLALLLLFWLARNIYMGVPKLVDLLWAPPSSTRPALRLVEPERLELGRRSVRAVLLVVLGLSILHFVALDLFDADRLNDLVSLLRTVAYIGVALWLLHSWGPALRNIVVATGDSGPMATRLGKVDRSPVLALVRAGAALVWLLGRGAAEVLVRVAEGRPGLGWLASALARARLRGSAEAVTSEPADPADLAQLDTGQAVVPRPEQVAELEQALTSWGEERRRGLIAVIGEVGSGKSAFLAWAEERARELLPDVPVVRLPPPPRLPEAGPALDWLAAATGIPTDGAVDGEADVEALIQQLSAAPTRIFIVDDLHRLVLRAVGGFAAARAVLRIMQATSEEHFWICAFHGPTWDYLAGVSSSVNLEAFRARIMLDELPAAQLAEWVRARVEAAGFAVHFDSLVGRVLPGPDAQRVRERAEQAYWRLLVDASMGNPEVAWGYFKRGLRRHPGDKSLDVRMFEAPAAAELEGLPDLDLFVLTAIVIHAKVDSTAIGQVLNAPLAQVQEACRQLDGLGIIDGDRSAGLDWAVTPRWRPAVRRILRQRHFLYMR